MRRVLSSKICEKSDSSLFFCQASPVPVMELRVDSDYLSVSQEGPHLVSTLRGTSKRMALTISSAIHLACLSASVVGSSKTS